MESAELTDDTYEEERRQAELSFLRGYGEWHQTLVTEARAHSPRLTKDAPTDLRVERKSAALKAGEELLRGLARLCSTYGHTELTAYAALLQRLAVPASRAVIRVRDHADATVDESQSKWDAGMEELSRSFSFGNLPEIAWDHIQKSLREFSKRTIERQLWTGPQSPTPGKSATEHRRSSAAPPETMETTEAERVNTGTDPVAEDRKALLLRFKAQARLQCIRVTDSMVAQAANRKWNDRTMVTWWKRNDPKIKQPHDKMIRAVLAKDASSIWNLDGSLKHPLE